MLYICYLFSLYIFVTIFHFLSISLSLSIYLVSFSISFVLSFFISFYLSFYFLDIFICTYTYMYIYIFTHNVYISLYLQPMNLIVIGLSKEFEKSFTRLDFNQPSPVGLFYELSTPYQYSMQRDSMCPWGNAVRI